MAGRFQKFMTRENGFRVLNYAGFNTGWLATVWGAGNGFPWLGPVFAMVYVPLHLYLCPNRWGEWRLLVRLAILGTLLETGFRLSGLVVYHGVLDGNPVAPLYIVTLWLMYASTLNYSMGWMRRSVGLAVVAGLVFGPLSYLAAVKLGAVTLPHGMISFVLLALAWGPANAGSVALAIRFDK